MSDDAWQALKTYAWPGNVRELRHAVARAVALGGDELGPIDFFPNYQLQGLRLGTERDLDVSLVPYQAILRSAMEQALKAHGTIRAAALSLGMPKSTFADKARQFREDAEIQALLAEITAGDQSPLRFDRTDSASLKLKQSTLVPPPGHVLPYERLDQLVVELLLGVRHARVSG